MNKYLLSILVNTPSEEMCRDVALLITPIVDSPTLKYHFNNGVIIFHFNSEIPKEEVYEYLKVSLFGITDSFFLNKITDNVSVFMPQEYHEYLFDLDNIDDTMTGSLDMVRVKNNLDFMEEEEDDIMALLLDEMREKNLFRKPSLDQILDKVLTNGIDSLSSFEKNTLETYSK
jgi:hypothetical protein